MNTNSAQNIDNMNFLNIIENLDDQLLLERSSIMGDIDVERFNNMKLEEINNLSTAEKYLYSFSLSDCKTVDRKKLSFCTIDITNADKKTRLDILEKLLSYKLSKKIPFHLFKDVVWETQKHINAAFYYQSNDPMIQLALCRWRGRPEYIKYIPINYIKLLPIESFKRIPIIFINAMTDEQYAALSSTLKHLFEILKLMQ